MIVTQKRLSTKNKGYNSIIKNNIGYKAMLFNFRIRYSLSDIDSQKHHQSTFLNTFIQKYLLQVGLNDRKGRGTRLVIIIFPEEKRNAYSTPVLH